MKRRKRDIIFMIIILFIIVFGGCYIMIKKTAPAEQTDQVDKMTLSHEEMGSLNSTQLKEQEKLLKEREEFGDKCAEVSMKPEYHDGKYGRTYNKDFMKEQCEFWAIYDMVEYEFVGYEELNNLSDYISDVRWDDKEELWKTGWYYNTNNLYIERRLMNADGTFNLQSRSVTKHTVEERGATQIYENSELTAVKFTVSFRNLSAKDNIIYYKRLFYLGCIEYGEDDGIYPISSLYERNIFFETYSPIYVSIPEERVPMITNGLDTSPMLSALKLQPYEEYTCDFIYVCFKDEFENMCLVSTFGLNGDEFNYKDLGTNIVMFSYLKETLEEK